MGELAISILRQTPHPNPRRMHSKLFSFFPMIPLGDLSVPDLNMRSDPTPNLPSNHSPDLPSKPSSQQSELPLPSGSPQPSYVSEQPSSTMTSLQQSLTNSWGNTMRYFLILLGSLSPIGLLLRIMPFHFPSLILDGSRFLEKITSYKFMYLSYVAALALLYALNYRKMKNPKDIAIMFLQVMITFPLILLFCSVFLCGEVGLDPIPTLTNPEPASPDSADHSDVPLTPSNTAIGDNTATGDNTTTAWYYSKKGVACCLQD